MARTKSPLAPRNKRCIWHAPTHDKELTAETGPEAIHFAMELWRCGSIMAIVISGVSLGLERDIPACG